MPDGLDASLTTAVAVAIQAKPEEIDPIAIGCRALCIVHGPHPGLGCYCDARGGRDCRARAEWREVVTTVYLAYQKAGMPPPSTWVPRKRRGT